VNFIDFVFILLFIMSLVVGFFQGMIRLAVMLAALYLSLVLSSLYFTTVGEWLMISFGAQRYVGQFVGFALVFIFGFIVLVIAGLYTFRYAQLPGGLVYFNHVAGVVLGMLLGTFFIGTFAALLYNLMIARGGNTIEFPVMRALGSSVNSSVLLHFFSTNLLPTVYNILSPVLPAGARLIFEIQ